MNLNQIAHIAEKTMKSRASHRERETGFAYFHGQRVAVGVIELRKRFTEDDGRDDLLRVAAMFHDVGKGFPDHSAAGAEIVKILLREELSADELNEVSRLIAAHDHRAPGTGKWDFPAQLLQDADLLDHFGTLETWINFHYYAHADEPIAQSVKFYRNEFFKDTERWREKLNFEESRRIFDEKIAFSRAFYQRMAVEARGEYVI